MVNEVLDDWFRLAHEGSISWRSVADMCAGAYQALVIQQANADQLNTIAQAWERARQLHERSLSSIYDLEFIPHA